MHPGYRDSYLTLRPLARETVGDVMARFCAIVRERGLQVLKQTVFGPSEASEAGLAALGRAAGTVDWPVTWVDGGTCDGAALAGIQAHGVAGPRVDTHRLDGRVVARSFPGAEGRWCVLGDIRPNATTDPAGAQASQMFANLERALEAAAMRFGDLVRTWLFLDRMLAWYDDLNAARTAFFREHRVFEGLVPASTGIGARNAFGGALVAEALALCRRDPSVCVRAVPSPLQCSAGDYGSSFSRAVEIAVPGCRRLLVSGTASIAPDGKTAHVGAVDDQIDLTMRVVDALLRSRCMSLNDVTRAVAYYRRAEDAPAFAACARRCALPELPIVHARDEVCRDDLLFEIELDAVRDD